MKWFSKLAAACVALGVAWAVQAQQQPPEPGGEGAYTANLAPPPEKLAVSPGGVDIRSGRYTTNETDLSVGALALTRILSSGLFDHRDPFGNFSHNWDITLIEERIDIARGIYRHVDGPDYRITVNFGGSTQTFQGNGVGVEMPHISKSPNAVLSRVGASGSASIVYTFTQSGGTRFVFRALGSRDCAAVVRCAYVSQIIEPDGTTTTFSYESTGAPNGTRLRSAVSNLGYALVLEYSGTGALWSAITKACVLNLTVAPKPANNVCPSNAVATSAYTYTTLEGRPKLASITDALGRTWSLAYTLLAGTSPLSGTQHTLAYTKPGQSTPWQVVTLAMPINIDAEQTVLRQDFADGSSYAYSYDLTPPTDDGQQSIAGGSFQDALSHATFVAFGMPRLPPTMNPPRYAAPASLDDVNYQVTPGPESIVDALGRITSYDYCDPNTMAGLPPYISDRCLVTNLQSVTDPQGVKTKYTFSLGHLMRTQRIAKPGSNLPDIVQSAGDICNNQLLCGKPSSITDARSNVTNFTYDPVHGGVLSQTLPAPIAGAPRPQRRYTYTQLYARYYNDAGVLAQAATPVWKVTEISECRTFATCAGTEDETRTTIGYGSPGSPNNLQPTSQTVAAGDGSISSTTLSTYDAQGNVVSVDGPLPGPGDTAYTRYDALRRVIGTINADPDGAGPLPHRAVRNTYSQAGDLTKVETGTVSSPSDAGWAGFSAQQALDTDYDSQGRKVRERVSAGSVTFTVTQYSYDLARRLECTAVRMDPTQWNSQSNACVPQLNGAFGPDRITRNYYNAADELVRVQVAVGTDVQADDRIQTYTSTGQLESITDGEGNKTNYSYDGHDRLKRTSYPDPANKGFSSTVDYEELSYDLNGNTTQRRLRDGQLINYGYDTLNRLTIKDLPAPELDVTYSYDLQGHLRTTVQGGSTVTDVWDALGRNRSETSTHGTMGYLYDEAGRRTRTTWPDSFYVTHDYFVTGELSAIREYGTTTLVSFAYDSLGRRSRLTRGNGTSTRYSYDRISRLTTLSQDLAATAHDVASSFGYNPASQITNWSRSNNAYAWTGHFNVNRTYAINGLNQISSDGTANYAYDGRGNLTTQGATVYGYTVENRLISGPAGASFSHDPVGRLAQSSGSAGTTRFQYDGTDLVAEYNSSNQLLRRYIHGSGDDEPLMWYEGSGTGDRRWLHQDERGSTVAVSNAAGAMLAVNAYDEYGVPAASNLGRFQYTGQTWLPELGMYYYKARVYSPRLGRFLQADPIGYDDGVNLYAYVGNEPVNLADPSGDFAILIPILVGASLEGLTQVVESALGLRPQGYELADIAAAGAASAAGFQLAKNLKNVQRFKKVLDLGAEAATSALGDVLKGEDVTLGGLLADLTGAEVARKAVGKLAKGAAENTSKNKILERAADRKQRNAKYNPRKASAAKRLREAQEDYVDTRVEQAVGSAAEVGSSVKDVACAENGQLPIC